MTASNGLARDVVDTLVGFARTLRAAGVDATPERVHAMLAAADALGAADRDSVYWAGRLTLCASADDIARYDRAFAAFFAGEVGRAPRRVQIPVVVQPVAVPVGRDEAPDEGEGDPEAVQIATASRVEVLRHRDVSELGARERAELARLVAVLRPAGVMRPSRRRQPAHSGPLDSRRMVRQMLRHGGEPVRLLRHDTVTRPRRLVMLIDISGSMSPYADTLLRFAHAACRCRPSTEVFTVGTRLTRISRELRLRDPVAALSATAAAIPDWSGGTRLGEELKEFLDRWGQRGTARGAVVVIASDGWERGDPSLLRDQMQRLHRLAYRVVWVNPHKGRDGYAPLTAGMQAALPSVDQFVAGHSLAALEELADLLTQGGPHA